MMQIDIDSKWCKGCEICIHNCPKGILKLSEKRSERGYRMPVAEYQEKCIGCLTCERLCPDLCIEVKRINGGKQCVKI